MNKLLSTTELAKILGISRVAVFKKIKSGEIKAQKVGSSYVIDARNLPELLGRALSQKDKNNVEQAVLKATKEYSETFKLLGRE